nr:MAG TPA: hypothetical protein [Caudoviricetes sp.]
MQAVFLCPYFSLLFFSVFLFSHTFLDTSSWCVGVPRCAFFCATCQNLKAIDLQIYLNKW